MLAIPFLMYCGIKGAGGPVITWWSVLFWREDWRKLTYNCSWDMITILVSICIRPRLWMTMIVDAITGWSIKCCFFEFEGLM